MRIAFVGIGQSYPSHLWMTRMRQMLGGHVVVNIDDLRNTERHAILDQDTRYVPRKLSRPMRWLRAAGLTQQTDHKLRSQWMLKEISQSRASLVFVHFLDFATQFNEVWQKLEVPVVVHCHGYDITWNVRHHVKRTRLHSPGYTDQVRSMSENVWFIANSNHTKNQLRQLDINPSKIFLKRFGVPLAEKPKTLQANKPLKVLFLGRLVDFKGPIETVEAFSKISSRHRNTHLDVAGGGVLMQQVKGAVTKNHAHSKITCHGSVSPTVGAKLRQQSAIFTAHNQVGAITGQAEAFGVSLLEAMGEGVPVITGRSGGIVDFIRHDENGMLFEPGDIDAHAAMLDSLLTSKQRRETLGAAAWQTVRDNYQSHHEQSDLIGIFEQVAQMQSRPTLQTESRRAA